MTECRHGLSEDCPGCMQEAIEAAFATCIMIVEEECGLDKKPAQGRDNYVHGKYDVGMAIVDRIKCAQRSPDETRMRVPAQRPLDRDKLWHIIAQNIGCQEDCQKQPNGCGCAQLAADAVLSALTSTKLPLDIESTKEDYARAVLGPAVTPTDGGSK